MSASAPSAVCFQAEAEAGDSSPQSPQLVVKHTFLEFVEHPGKREYRKASTDPALYCSSGGSDATSWVSECESTVASNTAPAAGESCPATPKEEPASSSCGADASGGHMPGPEPASPTQPQEAADSSAHGKAARKAKSRNRKPADRLANKPKTTIMMKNIPNNYTRDMLIQMLDGEGYTGQYDFLYLPIDFTSGAGLGYAFINLVHPVLVRNFWATFHGYTEWTLPTAKVCELSWSKPYQGLRANVQRYRNSSVMHPEVPDECKPVVFQSGVRVAFPAPTRRIPPP